MLYNFNYIISCCLDIFIHLIKAFVMSIFIIVQILLYIKNYIEKLKHLDK